MKIDIHTHILPPEIPSFKNKFGYGGFIELIKVEGTDKETTINAVAEDKSVVVIGTFTSKLPNKTMGCMRLGGLRVAPKTPSSGGDCLPFAPAQP